MLADKWQNDRGLRYHTPAYEVSQLKSGYFHVAPAFRFK
jgi:hypothetical protein